VRQAPGKLSHRLHLLRLAKRVLCGHQFCRALGDAAFERFVQFAQPLFGALALGQVEHGANHAYRAALLVADDVSAIKDIGERAVRATEAVLGRPVVAGSVNNGMNGRVDPVAVVWMDVLDPPVAGRFNLLIGIPDEP
jgi:hypothetical protein